MSVIGYPPAAVRPDDATRMKVLTMRQDARIVPCTEPATFETPPARQR